jgi:hypothetical protein
MFRNLFPGFGMAVVAFSAYVAYDNFIATSSSTTSHQHGGDDHVVVDHAIETKH